MKEHDNIVTLDTPIKRGDTLIETVTLIKPTAGTLRGVSLAAVAGSDVDAMIKVLPRMTLPALTEAEITRMELPDMIAIAGKVIGFLTPKSQQETSPEA
ncbi:phage tail assembly protein [Pectobacterium punjabense]|uniref:phage tail assembly protein n=1 Tax=Pectobacterium punjabense TaxID=2108399 RepID=UPI001BFF34F4|nr:phage tail assembly protein [Pectobacterium punjabense]MBT9186277.1 phage tail assembly protein [Pectobacterium punjabense]